MHQVNTNRWLEGNVTKLHTTFYNPMNPAEMLY